MRTLLIILLLCSCSPKIVSLEKEKQKVENKKDNVRKGKILIIVVVFACVVNHFVVEARE